MARLQAFVVVGLRWLIVPAWLAAAAYVAVNATGPAQSTTDVISLVPPSAPAIAVARREARMFRVPLSAETEVVQSTPNGISAQVQAESLAYAAAVDRDGLPGHGRPSFLAVPVPNTLRLAPGSRSSGTAIVTYLEFPPQTAPQIVVRQARTYADGLRRHAGNVDGVTGIVPAEWREGVLIQDHLAEIEIVAVLAIALLVGLKFRSVGSVVLTLTTLAVANVATDQVLAWAQTSGGVSIPGFMQPLEVALVMGVGTDYCIFYLTAFRLRMRDGEARVPAARRVSAETTPIVIVGGLVLAAGLASLEVARVAFFRDLGPGLALTVLATLAVAVTFVPAAIGIFGRVLLWPSRDAASASGDGAGPRPGRGVRLLMHRPVGAAVTVFLVAGLGVAVVQVRDLRVGFTEVTGLPASTPERSAYAELARGFAPGMLSPTVVVVSGPGLQSDRGPLARLQAELARRRDVTSVLGPADEPVGTGGDPGLVYGKHGNAARYVVVLGSDPFGASAIDALARLRSDLPALADRAGLGGRTIGVTGNTALAQETTGAMRSDVLRISLVAAAVNVILLAIFLRALVAPLLLVTASVLSLGATLGITIWTFGDLLGYGELTYWVPYAVGVLLISLGSDYNVFVAGRMWQEARRRPLRQAVAIAGPRASEAIRTAGLALAASFAAIALIPVRGFREFAFAMVLGILLETFVVRSLLVPALISLVGYGSGWPGKSLRRGAGVVVPDDG